MAAMPMRKLRLWQDKIETEVAIFGSGTPLVFLHGSWGLRNDQEFLDLLARTHTVYAPKHPGTSEGDSEAVHQIDDWWDLIVYHGELFDRLELKSPVLVGHSFGGLVACEIAAAMPERVEKLVLIDPVGLWREDMPVKNWMLLSPADLRAALFADPKGEHAEKFFQMPSETAERIKLQPTLLLHLIGSNYKGCMAKEERDYLRSAPARRWVVPDSFTVRSPVPGQNLKPDLLMMQPAQNWNRDDTAHLLSPAKMWSIFSNERWVRTSL